MYCVVYNPETKDLWLKTLCRYVDPNDPTRIFLQQPNTDSQLRRRTYQPVPQTDGGHV